VQQPGAKHGLTATATTVLLLDATIVNILGKVHLKAAPILFYTVPISMPFSLFFSLFSIFVLFLLFILVYLVVLPLGKVLRKIQEPCKSFYGKDQFTHTCSNCFQFCACNKHNYLNKILERTLKNTLRK
jgi:hypothetical protein